MSETRDKDTLYADADWQAYMLSYYEELIEEQKRRGRRDRMWTAASVALTVINCLLVIGYCAARIVL